MPCLNAEQTIGQQLAALARQNWEREWELIIVDNGSTDRTRSVVSQFLDRLPNLRIVEAYKRRSPGYARNVGAAAARGDVLLHCDADDEVGENWLAVMARALETHELVACRMDIDKLNPPWLRLVHANPQPEGAQAPLWYPPHLPHAAGATLGAHRALHERIGGFDENLAYLEDTDFCIRAQLAGATLVSVPEAVVHYRYRNTALGLYQQGRNYAKYNVVLYKRYRPKGYQDPWRWRVYLGRWSHLLLRLLSVAPEQGDAAGFGPWVGR
jgi:glycosyltransferase involved in cell wall biosynthesis